MRKNHGLFILLFFLIYFIICGVMMAFGEDNEISPIEARIYEVVKGGTWNRVSVIIPDGNLLDFFVNSSWELKEKDKVFIEFKKERIMDVAIVTPYLVFYLNETKIEL